MGISQTDAKMEGWLHLIRFNRFGLQFSRRRYFILKDNCLRSFKTIPVSDKEEPVRSAIIDSCIRVTDNGRESSHKKVLFLFTVYNTSNNSDQLKLGARSPEEAARWIRSLQEAALKECPNPEKDFVACSKRKWPLRLGGSKQSDRKNSMDGTISSIVPTEAMTSDVIAPSPWKIFGCQNGLRLFKEANDWDSRGGHWDDHPAIMAVGIIDGTSEAIFRTLMSLGSSRSEDSLNLLSINLPVDVLDTGSSSDLDSTCRLTACIIYSLSIKEDNDFVHTAYIGWDFCFYQGSVVEHLDGHTDIVQKLLYSDWLPWGMQRRDLLLRRYWRREDDGTYVILYHSVFHKKCPPHKGYVRACLKSGGYVITPMSEGKQSLVKHMLSIDWKFWKLHMRPSSARAITIRMLERLAALRELFSAKSGKFSSEFLSEELTRDIELSQCDKEDNSIEVRNSNEVSQTEESVPMEDEMERPTSGRKSLKDLNDAADEFFDVPEPTDHCYFENEWPLELSSGQHSPSLFQPKLSSAAVFVKKFHDLRGHKKGYTEFQEVAKEDNISWSYGATLQKDLNCASPCSWAAGDPSLFLIRGRNYLKDRQKIKAKGTLMQMVGADWLRSDKREDNLGSRPGGIVQNFAEQGGPEFFFIVNFQIPGSGSSMYTLAMYYMMKTPLDENPLLLNFVNGDDAYRNSRFKLIPYISKGSWIVKQSVGKKACLVGQQLESRYFRGKNYFELDIDAGSSTIARGVVSLVLGYLNNLVIEMAFLIQGNTEEELPEVLLGTCKVNQLDASKSLPPKL